MSYINISSLITEKTNIIEIFIINKNCYNDDYVDINLNESFINIITNSFKKLKETKYVLYHKNNLSYSYDMSDDSQNVINRLLENEKYINISNNKNNDLYCLSLNENKLGTHYFSCSDDIDLKEEYILSEFKINNRISIIVKNNNNCYILYKHNINVDLDRINNIINTLIHKIIKL